MITEVSLYPRIEIETEHDKERTERIVHKAEMLCLISNSVKSVVTVHPQIVLADKEIAPAA